MPTAVGYCNPLEDHKIVRERTPNMTFKDLRILLLAICVKLCVVVCGVYHSRQLRYHFFDPHVRLGTKRKTIAALSMGAEEDDYKPTCFEPKKSLNGC